jgi:biopolymer transport protein ExbB/TolQ/biopolymer transport protein ExbD
MEIFSEIAQSFLPSHEAFIFMWLLAAFGVFAAVVAIERFFAIKNRTDYNASAFFDKIRLLIDGQNVKDAILLCDAGNDRALPKIIGAGLKKVIVSPQLMTSAMTEESIKLTSFLEKRLNYIIMISNSSTLLGLLGTVFGLIMSFDAVGKPGIAAIEKTALLASGISAAMNSTLVGLTVSIICVAIYSWLRTKVDSALTEIDRYAVATVKIVNPPAASKRKFSIVHSRQSEGDMADTDVTPMLNLMVMLIPFLLSSSEFVKIGAIELKLPEASQGGEGSGSDVKENTKLDVGIVITSKGFNIYNYFKNDAASQNPGAAEIPMINNEYDFITLNAKLADVKRKALMEIIKSTISAAPDDANLYQLYSLYTKKGGLQAPMFEDHENVKIVAEEKINYETIVAVMDAARGTRTPDGNVTMFPNVSIAGGIVQ